MPTKYKCPDCESEVLIPESISETIEREKRKIGCNNVDDHDRHNKLVMWKEG